MSLPSRPARCKRKARAWIAQASASALGALHVKIYLILRTHPGKDHRISRFRQRSLHSAYSWALSSRSMHSAQSCGNDVGVSRRMTGHVPLWKFSQAGVSEVPGLESKRGPTQAMNLVIWSRSCYNFPGSSMVLGWMTFESDLCIQPVFSSTIPTNTVSLLHFI